MPRANRKRGHDDTWFPPRTHDLLRLASLAHIALDETKESFFRRITNYYIGTRYPEEVRELASQVDKKLADEYFVHIKELMKWLDSLKK